MKTSYSISYYFRDWVIRLQKDHATLREANAHYNDLKTQPRVTNIRLEKITILKQT